MPELWTLGGISIMRHFIVICLFVFPIVGCANRSRDAALQIWYSATSTPQQRAHAVSELVPMGASKQSVQSMLGTNGNWTHFYGPNFYLFSAPPDEAQSLHGANGSLTNWMRGAPRHELPTPYHDFWCLVYKFPDGGVQLFFDPPTAFGDRFIRVGSFNVPTNMPSNTARGCVKSP